MKYNEPISPAFLNEINSAPKYIPINIMKFINDSYKNNGCLKTPLIIIPSYTKGRKFFNHDNCSGVATSPNISAFTKFPHLPITCPTRIHGNKQSA